MKLSSFAQACLAWVAPLRCPGCDFEVDAPSFCSACDPLLEKVAYGPAAYEYGGPLADAIQRFKYERRVDLCAPLAQLLVRACLPLAGRVDCVVSVPLHPRRLRERGFDQARLLARPVARALGVPLVRGLRRTRDTQAQIELSGVAREANVRGAFVARRLSGRVLLIDDVRTTGATMNACALTLREAGARVRPCALAGTNS